MKELPGQTRPLFTYRAHGLSILTEAELPEASPARFNEPDVVVRYGDALPALAKAHIEGAGHQVAPGSYRLEVRGVGVYGLRAGRDVVITPEPDASPAAVRGPLLSSVMGAAVHERGYLALHASAAAVGDGCILFTGVRGVGKSTLAAACHSMALPVLSDDLVAIEISDAGAGLAHFGYGVVKLRSDAIERFGASFGAVHPLEGWPGKFTARIPGFSADTALPVRAIFDLGAPAPSLSIEPITGAFKVRRILARIYRRRMIPALGHADRTFLMAAALARTVPILSLRIPRDWNALARAVDQVQRSVARTLT